MKVKNKENRLYLFLPITAVFTFLLLNSFVHAEGTRGGGDPAIIREREFEKNFKNIDGLTAYISKNLGTDIVTYLENFKTDRMNEDMNSKVQAGKILALKTFRVADKIKASNLFKIEKVCKDENGELKGASTQNGVPGADICMSPEFLAAEKVSRTELIGIGIHEYARQYSLKDEKHHLADFVSQTFDVMVADRASVGYCNVIRHKVGSSNYDILTSQKLSEGLPMAKGAIDLDTFFVLSALTDFGGDKVALAVFKGSLDGKKSELIVEGESTLGARSLGHPFNLSVWIGDRSLRVHCFYR